MQLLETHIVEDPAHRPNDLQLRDDVDTNQVNENVELQETKQLMKALQLEDSLQQEDRGDEHNEDQEQVEKQDQTLDEELQLEDATSSEETVPGLSTKADVDVEDPIEETAGGLEAAGAVIEAVGADEGLEGSEPGLVNPALSSLMEGRTIGSLDLDFHLSWDLTSELQLSPIKI